MSRSDEELMQNFQEGNETAFITLYERYKSPIFRFIYRKLGRQARAEELAQEVFMALIQHRTEWRRESSFKTYIYRIAFNRCITEIRRSEHKMVLDGDDETSKEQLSRMSSDEPSPADEAENGEFRVRVQQALAKLDADHRDPILLREYEELSYEEIAEVLNIAVGTVKSRIFRGKLELKRLLAPIMNAAPVRAAGSVGSSASLPTA